MKIYTKKGDTGTTQLIGGTRVPKHHLRIETYGTVDELNSHIGLLIEWIQDENTRKTLQSIQDRLFTMGSLLAADPEASKMKLPQLHETDVQLLEEEIDRMTDLLPQMTHFILPGGSPAGAQAHITRCVCRRAERLITNLNEVSPVEEIIIRYINRLSDYFFTLGRFALYLTGHAEVKWIPRMD